MCQCGCHSHQEAIVFKVEGMTCDHCKMAVEKAVNALPGVSSAKVILEHSTLTVEFDASVVGVESIKNAVAEAGYKIL